MDDCKFRVKFSVAQATWQKIVLSHLNRAKDNRDGAKKHYAAGATEDFHVIFESEFVSDGYSEALDELYNTGKCYVAQAAYIFRAREQLFMCQFRFGAPLDKRCKFPVQRFAGEA
jgi:hypothetical protein